MKQMLKNNPQILMEAAIAERVRRLNDVELHHDLVNAPLIYNDKGKKPERLFERLIGYQANASSLDHCELDGAKALKTDEMTEWGRLMIELNNQYGVKILGGCCGTNGDHLRYLVENKK
ncbi:MAG: homocysteine S-methyltransferase family protein [gamma proteobacterium symbiont of Bathyaustriella thionipta]|nr:homocysteine S-methyltransferase family protein [gamma proteobacterium symbiont of Bathyaustriella thionipta]MCU7949268.1 homocysteine S-methyltransferase family protein [gamma proteobacterium symbiont of Bathyaustriella thionipta]MCU7954408.1 homocysteine S-methyltransferase family protein [gamma proteobacterium symbiont of Bathyaustriella thionipta]MCU7955871.1 homocysteine S-methyltransferase family protein [gamma proteobacterium symbiont of Bathyaustriella thionipta]MCU7967541.1 homocyst